MNHSLDNAMRVLRSAATRFAYKTQFAQIIRANYGSSGINNTAWSDLSRFRQQADYYTRSPWVYIAVNKIATTQALVELKVQQVVGESKRDVMNHPLEQLLRKPNQWQSQFEFLEMTYGYREISGNCYWFLNGAETGQPTELIVLRPDRVRVVPGHSSENLLGGYLYEVDGVQVPLSAKEVVHFKLFNPLDDYYGLSRMQAAALGIQADLAMEQYNYNYFGKDKAVPAGLVSIKDPVSDQDFERIQNEFRESYGGTQRKTAFIRGSAVQWQELGLSHRDMEFESGRLFNRDEIYQIFGIPPGLLDKSSTRANATVANEAFTRDTVWPGMVAVASKLTTDLCPYWGDDLIVEPVDIRLKDRLAERREIFSASQFLSVNEMRAKYFSLGPVAWGDKPAALIAAEAKQGASGASGGSTITPAAQGASTDGGDTSLDGAGDGGAGG
ncbi:MAG: phage portal protein [Chloroflexota bacterium]